MSVEDYEFQLEQVKSVLETDAENEQVKKLHQDLVQLLELLREKPEPVAQSQTTAADKDVKEKKTHKVDNSSFLVGEMVLAKFSDGNFYEAMIVEDGLNGEYECVFTGYESIQKLSANDIRKPKDGQPRQTLLQSKEVQIGEITSNPKKNLIKKKMKKKEKSSKRELEDQERTAAWQSFQAKNKRPFGGIQKKEMPKSSGTQAKTRHHYEQI
jgi:hypothetical protein